MVSLPAAIGLVGIGAGPGFNWSLLEVTGRLQCGGERAKQHASALKRATQAHCPAGATTKMPCKGTWRVAPPTQAPITPVAAPAFWTLPLTCLRGARWLVGHACSSPLFRLPPPPFPQAFPPLPHHHLLLPSPPVSLSSIHLFRSSVEELVEVAISRYHSLSHTAPSIFPPLPLLWAWVINYVSR